jgi:co-chaperonin GroES (HSP10)
MTVAEVESFKKSGIGMLQVSIPKIKVAAGRTLVYVVTSGNRKTASGIVLPEGGTMEEWGSLTGVVVASGEPELSNCEWSVEGGHLSIARADMVLLPHLHQGVPGHEFLPLFSTSPVCVTGDLMVIDSPNIIAYMKLCGPREGPPRWIPWRQRVMIRPSPKEEEPIGECGIVLSTVRNKIDCDQGVVVKVGNAVREVAPGQTVAFPCDKGTRCYGSNGRRDYYLNEFDILAVLE